MIRLLETLLQPSSRVTAIFIRKSLSKPKVQHRIIIRSRHTICVSLNKVMIPVRSLSQLEQSPFSMLTDHSAMAETQEKGELENKIMFSERSEGKPSQTTQENVTYHKEHDSKDPHNDGEKPKKDQNEDSSVRETRILTEELCGTFMESDAIGANSEVLHTDTTDNIANEKRKKARKKKSRKRQDSSDVKLSSRPNYFVAIPVSNPQIHRRIAMVQRHIVEQQKALSAALIPLGTLHLTLLVMTLDSSDQVERAQEVLLDCHNQLQHLSDQPLQLTFSGVGHFQNNILFASIDDGAAKERLRKVAETAADCYNKAGLTDETRDFKPHLTLMKLSRAPMLRKKGIKRVEPSLYTEVLEEDFGPQVVDRIQLCSMMKPKQPNGYYHVECEGIFHESVLDSATCLDGLSEQISREVMTRALETLREQGLAQSRKRKRESDITDRDHANTSKKRVMESGDGQNFVDQLEKPLTWTFKTGDPSLKSESPVTTTKETDEHKEKC